MRTEDSAYARRLVSAEGARWKRVLDVQRPYRWNLRRQGLGRTLDVGCGIGRNLCALPEGSLGVDHNVESVRIARQRGLNALTVEEFLSSQHDPFDGLLVAHVIEHMSRPDAVDLLKSYINYLRPGAKIFLVCPQERGFASDPTHVAWTSGEDLVDLAREMGLRPEAPRSFPFPRSVGRWFTYNEFNVLAYKP